MYVTQISPCGDRARIFLDPDNRSPVFTVFSECPDATRLAIQSPDIGTYVYERAE